MEFVSNFRGMLKNRFKENMEVLSTYKDKLASIQELVNRMENGSLEIAELSELERLTREVHERSIILRYKAMERKVKPQTIVSEVQSVEEEIVLEEEVVIETVEEPKEQEEVSLDFALFDTTEEEEEIISTPAEVETPVQVAEEPVAVEEKVEETKQAEVIEEPAVSTSGFVNKVKIPADAMAHYSVVKIRTLIGVFGLNERLRFINELFDGSSEDFSEAIKKLDTFESIEEASGTIDHLAATHLWDAGEEAVQEFIIVLKRRYA